MNFLEFRMYTTGPAVRFNPQGTHSGVPWGYNKLESKQNFP